MLEPTTSSQKVFLTGEQIPLIISKKGSLYADQIPESENSSQEKKPPRLMEKHSAADLLARRTLSTFQQQENGSTVVSQEDFNKFQTFTTINFPKLLDSPVDRLWQSYTYLYRYQTSKKTILYQKQEKLFIKSCWEVATLFNTHAEKTSIENYNLNYRMYCGTNQGHELNQKAYQENIHPLFLIFQRFINLAVTIAKPVECLGVTGIRVLKIDDERALAFTQDSQGFVPVPFCPFAPLEIIYIHYGEQIFQPPEFCCGKVFIFEEGKLNSANGFLLEMTKHSIGETRVNTRGYYGGNTAAPFYASSKTIQSNLDSAHLGTQSLLLLLQNEIEKFHKDKTISDTFFIPTPDIDSEKEEFCYFLIQDLISQSYSTEAEHRENALLLLGYIESELGSSIEEISLQLEEQIKHKISSPSDKEIEAEWNKAHKSVIDGTKEKGKRRTSSRRGKKTAKAQLQKKKHCSHSTKVEQDFEAFKVTAAKKYKYVVKIAQDLLKEMPLEQARLVKEIRRGSHHTLHFPKGGAVTIVEPHGKKELVPQKTVNRFIEKLALLIQKNVNANPNV